MKNQYEYEAVMNIQKKYKIVISHDIFSEGNSYLARVLKDKNTFIVFDKGVGNSVLLKLKAYFKNNRLKYGMCIVRGGELDKNSKTSEKIASKIVAFGLHRGEFVIGIGGGAVLDMAGYTAARVHRGVSYINIPTTLLSQIDAGVGVKNAVNFGGYKNTLGSFYPPNIVIIDPQFLKTLPIRELRCGMAEAIKVSIMLNRNLFEFIEIHCDEVLNKKLTSISTQQIIWDTIITHVKQIETDPYEARRERPLVFGHEWAHWIEIQTKHRVLHGEAVSIGVAIDSHIALQRGLLSQNVFDRIISILLKSGLPVFDVWMQREVQNGCKILFKGLQRHLEHQHGKKSLIALPKGIGQIEYVNNIAQVELFHAVQFLKQLWKK